MAKKTDQVLELPASFSNVSIGDCKGFSASRKRISAGLTFALNSIDVPKLCVLAKRDGRLVVRGVEELPEDESEDGDEE